MKKSISLILALVMLLSMSACGSSSETAPTEPAVEKSLPAQPAVDKAEAAPAEVTSSTEEDSTPSNSETEDPTPNSKYDVELKSFDILVEDQLLTYQYRPGMSLCDWACSELNIDGWIPWFDDTVLSPDRKYMATSYHWSLDEFLGEEHEFLPVEENNGHNHFFVSEYAPSRLSSTPTVVTIDGGSLAGGSLENMSQEELKDFLAKNGINVGGKNVVFGGPLEGVDPSAMTPEDMGSLVSPEDHELALFGNISLPVAHMVNAKTPLFTPGFRIISKNDGRIFYHPVRLGYGYYLLDDVLDIYMNNISDEVLPHVKLYAFPESDAFLESLGNETILNAHPTPLEQGSEMLSIPENAVCLTFQRVPDGQDAADSLNPRTSEYPNENKDAVFARYVTKDDPNFGEGVNLVFAITYDDELVYWIHMGANFNETADSAPNEMTY